MCKIMEDIDDYTELSLDTIKELADQSIQFAQKGQIRKRNEYVFSRQQQGICQKRLLNRRRDTILSGQPVFQQI